MTSRLAIVFVFVSLASCKPTTTQPVEIRHYTSSDSLRLVVKSNLTVTKENDWTEYAYRELTMDDSVYNYLIKQKRQKPLSLKYSDLDIPLIEEKEIEIEGKKFLIGKYQFDDPDSYDEEESIYFIENYGAILISGDAWGLYAVFDRGGVIEKKIIEFIQKDTSGFYGVPEPPKK